MTIDTQNPYHIQLDVFEGPLDLLLHLIKENQLDIWNIPISKITDQYLQYLEVMKTLNLDIAGEFLLMAATLAHIKSKMLLPMETSEEDQEEQGQDPRAELVARLLQYQKYKDAAEQLWALPLLNRDTFIREKSSSHLPVQDSPRELVEVSVFRLVEAFHQLLEKLSHEHTHNVVMEEISISECLTTILETLRSSEEGTIRFQDLFQNPQVSKSKQRVVTTFLALLDLIKRGMIRVFQAGSFSDIQLMGTPSVYTGEMIYERTHESEQQTTH